MTPHWHTLSIVRRLQRPTTLSIRTPRPASRHPKVVAIQHARRARSSQARAGRGQTHGSIAQLGDCARRASRLQQGCSRTGQQTCAHRLGHMASRSPLRRQLRDTLRFGGADARRRRLISANDQSTHPSFSPDRHVNGSIRSNSSPAARPRCGKADNYSDLRGRLNDRPRTCEFHDVPADKPATSRTDRRLHRSLRDDTDQNQSG